jgi:hypothetical protein
MRFVLTGRSCFHFQTIPIVPTSPELVYMRTPPVTDEQTMQPLREENNIGTGVLNVTESISSQFDSERATCDISSPYRHKI